MSGVGQFFGNIMLIVLFVGAVTAFFLYLIFHTGYCAGWEAAQEARLREYADMDER